MVSLPQPLVSLASLAEASGEGSTDREQAAGAGGSADSPTSSEKAEKETVVASSAFAGGEAASPSPGAGSSMESKSSLQSPGQSISGDRPSGGDTTRNAVEGGLTDSPGDGNNLLRNMLLALGIVFLAVLIWSVQANRRFSKDVS